MLTQSHYHVIPHTISLVFRQKSLQIVVCHRTDAGIRPYIFGCFHHVDDGIDGHDDAQNGDGSTDARHQRECQEEAAHGDSRVADGGNDGDKEPQEDGAEGERRTAILYHKE